MHTSINNIESEIYKSYRDNGINYSTGVIRNIMTDLRRILDIESNRLYSKFGSDPWYDLEFDLCEYVKTNTLLAVIVLLVEFAEKNKIALDNDELRPFYIAAIFSCVPDKIISTEVCLIKELKNATMIMMLKYDKKDEQILKDLLVTVNRPELL